MKLTLGQVARLWDVDIRHARRVLDAAGLVGEKSIFPRTGLPCVLYDEAAVVALNWKRTLPKRQRRDPGKHGELTARVFRCAAQGMTYQETVIAVRADAAEVLEMYDMAVRDPDELMREQREKREQAEHEKRVGRTSASHRAKLRRLFKATA